MICECGRSMDKTEREGKPDLFECRHCKASVVREPMEQAKARLAAVRKAMPEKPTFDADNRKATTKAGEIDA